MDLSSETPRALVLPATPEERADLHAERAHALSRSAKSLTLTLFADVVDACNSEITVDEYMAKLNAEKEKLESKERSLRKTNQV